jgi:hypothetical protein
MTNMRSIRNRAHCGGEGWQPQLDPDFAAEGTTRLATGSLIHQPIPGTSVVLTAVSAAVMLRTRDWPAHPGFPVQKEL